MVGLSGDYDFQFLIEELAVGAQFNLPYVHVVVNNSYLGLIRQAQRNFDMNFCVSLAFDNINAQEEDGTSPRDTASITCASPKALAARRFKSSSPRTSVRR